MVSTNFNLSTLALVLIVFTVFTVALTENLQLADGFSSQSTANWTFDLSPGESQDGQWVLFNSNKTTHIEFRAEQPGSEFFTFQKNVVLEPNERREIDFIVTIPKDHPDNIRYLVNLFAKEFSPETEGGAAVVKINYEMVARPVINIGDNPLYTQPVAPVVVEEEPKPAVQEEISDDDFGAIEVKPLETIADKLAKIQEANKANTAVMGETPAEATGQFEVEDPVPDFEPELRTEINPVGTFIEEPVAQEEKVECGFVDWILSLFGMGKC